MDRSLHYSVSVGINLYPALTNLNNARDDAKAFHQWVTDPAGGGLIDQVNAFLIVADPTAKPSVRETADPVQKQVFAALNRIRNEVNAKVDDDPTAWNRTRLYFYGSGHGIAPVAQDAALLMADAGPLDYGENVSCAELRNYFLTAQTFAEVLVFADCCREYADAPLGTPPWTRLRRTWGNVNHAFCCATYFGDYAFEPDVAENAPPDERRGYFTRALLEGLRGEAADPKTGHVDTTTLAGYVQKRVALLTKERARPQTVNLSAEPGRPILLAELPVVAVPPNEHPVELEFSDPAPGTVELMDGTKLFGTYDSTLGPWSLKLPNNFYRVVPVNGGGRPLSNDGFFEVRGGPTHAIL